MTTRWMRTAGAIVERAQIIAAEHGARRIEPAHLAAALSTWGSDRSSSRRPSPAPPLSSEARAIVLAAWATREMPPRQVTSALARVLQTSPGIDPDSRVALEPVAALTPATEVSRWQDHVFPENGPYPVPFRSRLRWLGRFGHVRLVRRMDRVFDP